MAKIHYGTYAGGRWFEKLCKPDGCFVLRTQATRDIELVTCKVCDKKIKKLNISGGKAMPIQCDTCGNIVSVVWECPECGEDTCAFCEGDMFSGKVGVPCANCAAEKEPTDG